MLLAYSIKMGSSPRMRGAPRSSRNIIRCWRIIPADAGSTCRRYGAWVPSQDHPRGCGEHELKRLEHDIHEGSSPRMRGALVAPGSSRPAMGIIPADAGSTSSNVQSRPGPGDHPRGCGEHSQQEALLYLPRGSSPRMRGALSASRGATTQRRIIPADAGST